MLPKGNIFFLVVIKSTKDPYRDLFSCQADENLLLLPKGNELIKEAYKHMLKIYSVEQLGELICQERKKQGLTQEQLAGICGTGRRFIGEIESGKESCQLGKVIHVLLMLGIELCTNKKGEHND